MIEKLETFVKKKVTQLKNMRVEERCKSELRFVKELLTIE